MVYTLIGKLLNYACVPDPEHAKFSSTEAYAWEPVRRPISIESGRVRYEKATRAHRNV